MGAREDTVVLESMIAPGGGVKASSCPRLGVGEGVSGVNAGDFVIVVNMGRKAHGRIKEEEEGGGGHIEVLMPVVWGAGGSYTA